LDLLINVPFDGVNDQYHAVPLHIEGQPIGDFVVAWLNYRRDDRVPYYEYAVFHRESGTVVGYDKDPDAAIAQARARLKDGVDGALKERFVKNKIRLAENEELMHQAHRRWVEETYPGKQRGPRTGAVYLIKSAGRYKLGQSLNPEQRITGMQLPEKPQVLVIHHTPKYREAERELHLRFADKRGHGEWFDFKTEELPEVEKAIRAF